VSDEPQNIGELNPLNATEGFDPASLGEFSNFDSPTQAWDSAGIFTSSANLIYDGIKGDWTAVLGDLAGFGMDLLGFVTNPLGSLLSAGIGWLIEHIGFLKEALDLLAGDPDAVNAMATTWSNIAKRMQETADKYSSTLDTLSGAQGAAIDGYRKAVQDFSNVVAGGASHATSAARAMTVAASAVGVVRGAVRDAIASFVSNAIIKFAAASALAPVTFGASEAAFIADTVAEGAITAGKNAKKISKVVKQLEKVADEAKNSRNMIKGTTKNLEKTVSKYNKDAVDHARKALNTAKKARAGKLDANDLDRLKELGKHGDELKKAKGEAAESLADTRNANLRDRMHTGDPRFDNASDMLEREVTPKIFGKELPEVSLPKYPKILGNAAVQEWSDQSHREADQQSKQDDKDDAWRKYWEEQRGNVGKTGPFQRMEGDL
jgi:ABC-type transporter Mla subunit MlaD